ncbi:MAG: AtpZ/AtpI family protein [Candidatus Omnitrophica bacterium]|nr:AtpZ/AtpI family protein [Candidatus Omnitrophota bacterium]
MKNNEKLYPLVRNVGIVITIPMVFAVGPIFGFLIGSWIDEKWQLDPWGKIVLSLLGFIASIRQVIRLIKTATKDSN